MVRILTLVIGKLTLLLICIETLVIGKLNLEMGKQSPIICTTVTAILILVTDVDIESLVMIMMIGNKTLMTSILTLVIG